MLLDNIIMTSVMLALFSICTGMVAMWIGFEKTSKVMFAICGISAATMFVGVIIAIWI